MCLELQLHVFMCYSYKIIIISCYNSVTSNSLSIKKEIGYDNKYFQTLFHLSIHPLIIAH